MKKQNLKEFICSRVGTCKRPYFEFVWGQGWCNLLGKAQKRNEQVDTRL